jgi:two-component system response regulator RegX3
LGLRLCHSEAVAIANQGHFDLIILDVSMPLCDGFAAAREIRKTDRTTPILFISLARTELFIGVARKIGANGYVTKSDPSTRILEAIDSLLDKRDFFPVESPPGQIS